MTTRFKHIHVIINPAAGQDTPVLNVLNRVFREYGAAWDVSLTQQHGDGERLAQAAVAAGADLVASYGGDGTALDVASGLAGGAVPQMILPGGTANALAQELSLPLNLEEAARIIFNNTEQQIDLGWANERYFVLRADMGLSAQIVEAATREMKDQYGVLAYGVSALRALSDDQRTEYTLELDSGETVTVEGAACLVANANKIGTFQLTLKPTVNMYDGLLDIFVFNSVAESLLSAAAQIIRLQDGAASTLQHWQVREATISARPGQNVRGDGEALGKTPVHIRVIPRGLRVLAPG